MHVGTKRLGKRGRGARRLGRCCQATARELFGLDGGHALFRKTPFGGVDVFSYRLRPLSCVFVIDLGDLRIAATPFAQENLSILLDTRTLGEQAHVEFSPFEVRLPLRSPTAVSLKAKLRIER